MWVKRKVDAAVVEIPDDQYDDAIHERSDDPTVGGMESGALASMLGEAVAEGTRTVLEAAGLGKVNRETVAGRPSEDASQEDDSSRYHEYSDESRSALEGMRATPAWEMQYSQLPEAERNVRTPEGDVLTHRHLTALYNRDTAGLRRVFDDYATHYGASREAYARAALGTGAALGGKLVPVPLSDVIALKRDARERLAPRSMVVTSDGTTLRLPRENATISVAQIAEGAAITESNATFDEVILTKKKSAVISRSSKELMEDVSAAFSLTTILSNQFARKFAANFDAQGAQDGDGVGENHTDAIAEATITTTTSAAAMTRKHIVDLVLGVPTAYRDGGGLVIMGNSAMTGFLSEVEDTTGRPLYGMGTAAAVPVSDSGPNVTGIVEGLPYVELPFTANLLYVGLLSEGFAVLKDSAISVEVSDQAVVGGESTWERHQVAWKATERRDSAVVNAESFRKFSTAITSVA